MRPHPSSTAGSRRRAPAAAVLAVGVCLAPFCPPACGGGAAVAAEPQRAATSPWSDVADLVRSEDADLRAVGLERIRYGLAGEAITREVATTLLPAVSPAVQVAVLSALAGRGDPAAATAVARLAESTADPAVRAAALKAVAVLGGAAEVPLMVRALAAEPVRATARRALVDARGDGVAGAIVSAAAAADPATRAVLLDVLVERRERAAIATLVKALGDGDASVRQAAIRGLARLGGPDEVPAAVDAFITSTGDDRKALEQALVAVCGTNRGREQATPRLIARFTAADDDGRDALLPVLARLGDPQVMKVIDGMIADPSQRRRGLESLAKWPDASVADRLVDLYSASADDREKSVLLAALIRIAPLPDNKLNDAQKLDLVRRTMGLCQRTEDKAKLLERVNAIRTVEALRFVMPYLDEPALAEPACLSVVELAHHQKLRDANKAEFTTALDKVLATTKNQELVERATRYKAGQTWDRAKKG